MVKTPNDSKNTVASLIKGLRVLESFSAQHPEMTMSEIARRSDVDNATAFRFLNTLVGAGYVQRVEGTRLFRLSVKVLDLGFNAISHSDLRAYSRPILRRLVGEVNEAASIGVLEGHDVIYMERIHAGLTRLGIDIRIGSRVPAYSTAIGHAILAWLPEDTQRRILSSSDLVARTKTTLTDLDELLNRLKEVRAQGYAISDQENVTGLYIVAAPILDPDGIPLAAVSAVAPAMRTSLEEFKLLALDPIKDAASELMRILEINGGVANPKT